MKQSKSSEGVKAQVRTASVKKVSAAFGLVLTLAAVGAVGYYGATADKGGIATDEKEPVVTTAPAVTEAPVETYEADEEYSETVTWWKAGVEDYDFAEVTTTEASEAETETTTTTKKTASTKAETTTAAKKTTKATTTKKTSAKKTTVEEVNGLKVYATAAVNVRKGADTSYDKLGTLAPDTEVKVTGKTSDGWYRIKYGDQEGYVCADFFTTDKPAAATTAATTKAAKKTTTTTTAAKKAETTTTAAPQSNSGTISYTDEEYEMLCYVLQGEVGNCSEASKIAVANVVINRVKSGRFGNSIKAVLTAPNQFTAINGYYNRSKTPSQNTRDCALRALNGEDNSNGATYYYAPRYCGGATAAWFESLTFCMELDGQRYFR